MRMLESLTVGTARIDSNEFCWKVAVAAFWWGMQHFSKSSWDEDCTPLNPFGQTVLPNFLEYTHIIWLARWIFRASLQIAFHTAQSFTKGCVLATQEKKACNLRHPAHLQNLWKSDSPQASQSKMRLEEGRKAFHGDWDTAGWQLAEDTLYLSFIGCCKTRIRLNYFQQSAKDTSLAFAWRNLLHDPRTEGWTTSKHRWKEAQNHRLAGIKSWPGAQEYNQLAESVWNWSTPFSPCYELRRNLQVTDRWPLKPTFFPTSCNLHHEIRYAANCSEDNSTCLSTCERSER